jgi:hypothetical protein
MNAKQKQLEAIKNGVATHTKTYGGRLQPFGPKAPLPTRNAVLLSTVPASSNEKFNGGRDSG